MLRVRLCGGLAVEADGHVLPDALLGGRQGRLALAFLVCERSRSVRREELAELLWADQLPDSWSASLSAVISRLRRLLGEAGLDGAEALTSNASTYRLVLPEDTIVDLDELVAAVAAAEAGARGGDTDGALAIAGAAEAIAARGFLSDDGEWVDRQRDLVRDLRVRAALARSAAHLVARSPGRAVEAARDALALDDTREAAYRQLMLALAASGERAEALRVWERCRTTLVEELGVDPSPETEAVYRQVLGPGDPASPVTTPLPSGVVTFLLTDIVESSALWDDAPAAMAVALERHDGLIADVVGQHGGTLLKSKLEGDATVSVFARATDGVAAAIALGQAVDAEDWPEGAGLQIRMALHTGEAFERGGDYFGPALNRAARLRGLGRAGDLLLSQAVTELVRDRLPDGVSLRDLGHRELRGLARGENVYSLTPRHSDGDDARATSGRSSFVPPALPAALAGSGPFVGRSEELERLLDRWGAAAVGAAGAVFVGGEPGVGKSRLAAELAARAHADGATVLHGRCDEDLAAALHPFVEAVRPVIPALGAARMEPVRGVDELARVLPELTDVLPARGPTVRADPDTERLALFDAFVSVLRATSAESPVLLILDDLQWAGKTTLSLLRHVLREAGRTRMLVIGTYRDTELARTHPLAETLADLRRDHATSRVSLAGLGSDDVSAYLAAVGIGDRVLGRELAEITSGNPYFLIEVVRHIEEAGGAWSIGDLPEGVREATGRRLSRLAASTNRALSVASVVGTTFDLELVERVDGNELVDEIAEACAAGLVVEEPATAGRFRFAHAIVRQVLLAELVTIKRARLHRQIAELLDAAPVGSDPAARLTDLAYHWSECASLGDAGRAVDACRRAAEQATERLAYEEAGDLYSMALHVLDVTEEGGEARADLQLARCEALLAAGDVARAREAVDALERAAPGSERIAAWYSTFTGLLAVLAEPDQLPEIVRSIGAAADAMRALGDLRGEAQAHYVHATALERLGQIAAAERALDAALTAARSADDRGLADSILAEAPLAALWGPSPVTRASGRCLDVVRVLRINGGAPAVESVAIRCQAVLEALRGRSDAARRMVGSARRTAERLGLTHRGLEAEVAAGFIELLDGAVTAAEEHLRPAYHALRERGLDGEAAQAAAFLARALLVQDRVDEADDMAAEAQELAGADLKAGIAWRGVRAECAARRNDGDHALRLAREAVDLATTTDALLLVADARLSRAAVLRALGMDGEADDEARRALEVCSAKGATSLAARVGESRPPAAGAATDGARAHATLLGTPPTLDGEVGLTSPRLLLARSERIALLRWDRLDAEGGSILTVVEVDEEGSYTEWHPFAPTDRRAANLQLERLAPAASQHDNAAWRAAARIATSTNQRDWGAYVAALAPGARQEDRRPAMRYEDSHLDEHRMLFQLDDVAYERTPVGFHGDRRVLCRDVIWLRDGAVHEAEITTLQLVEVDEAGLVVTQTSFGTEDLATALAALHADAPVPGRTPTRENGAWRAWRALARALGAKDDWDAVAAALDAGFEYDDRRSGVRVHATGEAAFSTYRTASTLDDFRWQANLLATRGDRLALLHDHVTFADQLAGRSETVSITLIESSAAGRVLRTTTFDDGGLEDALAELDLRGAQHAAPEQGSEAVRSASAWRALQRLADAINAHDWDALMATIGPGYEVYDRRGSVTAPDGTDPVAVYRMLFSLDDWSTEIIPIEQHGDRRVLARYVTRFQDGAVAESEVESLVLVEVDDDGLLASNTTFAPDDLEAAIVALHAGDPAAGAPRPQENDAWRASVAFRRAFETGDEWDGFAATLADGFEIDDRRSGVRVHATGDAALDLYRTAFGLDENDLDGALAELDRRSGHDGAAMAAPIRENAAWGISLAQEAAAAQRDWGAFAATLHDGYEYVERRRAMLPPAHASSDAFYRTMFALDDWHFERELLATRSDRLALVRQTCRFQDGAVGPAESTAVAILEVAADGRLRLETAFDTDDLDAAREELDRRAAATPRPNRAWESLAAAWEAFERRDWDSWVEHHHPDQVVHHRQRGNAHVLVGPDAFRSTRVLFGMAEADVVVKLLASEGELVALVSYEVRGSDGAAGPFEYLSVNVVEITDDGRIVRETSFEPEDIDAARALLQEWAARSAPPANAAAKVAIEQVAAAKRRDWDTFAATLHPEFECIDRRRAIQVPPGAAPDSHYRSMFALDDWHFDRTLLASRSDRFALVRTSCRFQDGATGPAESTAVTILEVAADGRLRRETPFDPEDFDVALAELDDQARAEPRSNRAWQSLDAAYDAFERRDWDGWVARFLPEQIEDHRQRGNSHVLVGSDALRTGHVLWELDEAEVERRLVAIEGDRVALVYVSVHGSDGAAGRFEYRAITVVEVADDGRIARRTSFDPEDAHVAASFLRERAAAPAPPRNGASEVVAAQELSFARRDWDSFRATIGHGFTVDDRRRTAAVHFDDEESIATLHYAFDLPGIRWRRPLIATRGDRLALTRDEIDSAFPTNQIDYEATSLTLVELDAVGRVCRHTVFEVEDLPGALALLDTRAGELDADSLS